MPPAPQSVDLAQLARQIGPLEPIEFQRRANQWLRALRAEQPTLQVGRVPLDWLDALRSELNRCNGLALTNVVLARAVLARRDVRGHLRVVG